MTRKKEEMLEFVGNHLDVLKQFHLVATRTTGTLINEKYNLNVETMMSGPLGGDQQIGAMVATEKVDYVIFMRDPLNAQPHEPDNQRTSSHLRRSQYSTCYKSQKWSYFNQICW